MLARAPHALVLLTLAAVAISTSAHALPPDLARKVVDDARSILGAPYELGGRFRATRSGVEGIDCQGLVFFSLQTTSTCGWKSWSVMPTLSIAAREVGAPVALGDDDGGAAVATAKLDASKLEPGDVIHFVGFLENPAEKAIGVLDDKPVWVWHMALASGDGHFIASDPFVGRVIEEDLKAHLAEHADLYAGVLVTRMSEGPKAARCRRHASMIAPVADARGHRVTRQRGSAPRTP